jgi:branched-chain amino acid transport system ATP-binding protein
MLSIKGLTAGYADLHVLNKVDLEVRPGEMVVLVGPNGAGKSTVLKSIYGLTTKTAGTIEFQGIDISRLPTHSLIERGIGFVPQGRLVFPSLSVDENLQIGGYLLDHKQTLEINREHVFDLFPILREKQKELAGHLSGGQQQQLAIGRALMTAPEFLMLDEPSLGLSPKLMHEVFSILEKIRQSGTTVLIVEQNVRLALRYVDRGYVLANGRITFQGDAEALEHGDVMKRAYLS